jgi:hypothetical protein
MTNTRGGTNKTCEVWELHKLIFKNLNFSEFYFYSEKSPQQIEVLIPRK